MDKIVLIVGLSIIVLLVVVNFIKRKIDQKRKERELREYELEQFADRARTRVGEMLKMVESQCEDETDVGGATVKKTKKTTKKVSKKNGSKKGKKK